MFENKDKIVIVMEYASRGDLYDYICDKKKISEREARHFFRQIVSAVHYCHQVRGFDFGLVWFCASFFFFKSLRSPHADTIVTCKVWSFAGSVGSLYTQQLRQTAALLLVVVSGCRAPPELHNRHYPPPGCCPQQGHCGTGALCGLSAGLEASMQAWGKSRL